jgi:transmembrane sensor
MDKHSFDNLIARYQKGVVSDAEKALVEEYYRRLENFAAAELSAEEEAELKEAIFQHIRSGMQPRQMPLYKRVYFSLSAAAAVLLFFVAGYWFLETGVPGHKSKSDLATITLNDVPPGSDAAILTLANGKQILLDSTSGTISKQAGTTVINLNGVLTYKTGGTPENVAYNTISTARGNQYQLALADGSKIWLNSASRLRFPTAFAGTIREVELLSGEAYFDIARDVKKPFRVRTNDVRVGVLGTHFNVNAYSDEGPVKTTLIEGSVKLSMANSLFDSKQSVMLQPGEQAVINDDRFVVSHPDIAQVIAWKAGLFEFDNTDLPTIMRQISRWYDVDVTYTEKPTNEKFGGSISKNLPLSNVLRLLEGNNIRFKIQGKKLFVQP